MKIRYLSLVPAILTLSVSSAYAGAEISPVTTTPVNTQSTAESTLTPISSTSTLSQQAAVIQNNTGIGTIGTPSCPGTCLFTIFRVIPSGNNTTVEATIGAIWQLSSPENTQAQAYKIKANAESENLAAQTDTNLAEKISEALKSNDLARANAIAILLARRLGYSDYRQLIRDICDRGTTLKPLR